VNSRDKTLFDRWYAILSPKITRLVIAESLLKRWLTFQAEPAGVTADIISDSDAFTAKMAEIEATRDALIAETRAALAKGNAPMEQKKENRG
jgi:uncharacterized protein YecA (UPF0149 family)